MTTTSFCANCGATVMPGDTYCGECGARVIHASPAPAAAADYSGSPDDGSAAPTQALPVAAGPQAAWPSYAHGAQAGESPRPPDYWTDDANPATPQPNRWTEPYEPPPPSGGGRRRGWIWPAIAVLAVVAVIAAGTYFLFLAPSKSDSQAVGGQSASPVAPSVSATPPTAAASASSSAALPSWQTALPAGLDDNGCASSDPDYLVRYGTQSTGGGSVSCVFAQQVYQMYEANRQPDGTAQQSVADLNPDASGSYDVTCAPLSGYVVCTWIRPDGNASTSKEYILGAP